VAVLVIARHVMGPGSTKNTGSHAAAVVVPVHVKPAIGMVNVISVKVPVKDDGDKYCQLYLLNGI